MGRARKRKKIRTVKRAGTPITQKELTPSLNASSTVTRIEVAPIHEATRVRKTQELERSREARKKSSRVLIFLVETNPTLRRITR
jgi:hypothetical protein